jgi:uncharacterized protein (DUF2164 family)
MGAAREKACGLIKVEAWRCVPRTERLSNEAIMTIELTKEARAQAVASIERYFREHMDEPIGNVAAGALLGFFLEEIGPSLYNQAVADAQERLLARVQELDIEVHEDEFQYWKKFDQKKKGWR